MGFGGQAAEFPKDRYMCPDFPRKRDRLQNGGLPASCIIGRSTTGEGISMHLASVDKRMRIIFPFLLYFIHLSIVFWLLSMLFMVLSGDLQVQFRVSLTCTHALLKFLNVLFLHALAGIRTRLVQCGAFVYPGKPNPQLQHFL